ncbi:MAG: DUF4838 domain-containing protein [Pirellulales bacterium]|nr:DUF4838 domain-containing protein [Pirellulales bacterium]
MKQTISSVLQPDVDRRQFLRFAGSSAVVGLSPAVLYRSATADQPASSVDRPFFKTRGVVLVTKDLREVNWPQIAKEAGLSTIGTHVTPSEVAGFVRSEKGERFLDECTQLDIQVEHELHAMKDLLPRNLFDKNPEMFRMNKNGERVGDWNCCVHSKEGLEVICRNAVYYSRILRATTGRYFYWIDDDRPMCKCSQCRAYSDSDQALILENAMIQALRKENPNASLAHLAYLGTLAPPKLVKPEPGIFLEFAPICRSWAHPLAHTEVVGRETLSHGETLDCLDANLEVFPRETAQVLEYWLDVSLHSDWKRPVKRPPWNPAIFHSDLDTYAKRGIRHVTTFAAWIDGDYVREFGHPKFVKEYGDILLAYGREAGE